MSTKNNDGFISIIAIGVFALLMIFAISLQMTVIDTLQNLKNGVNYDAARDTADSTIEYLQWKMKGFAPGLNDTANCIFKNGEMDTTDQTVVNTPVCGELAGIIGKKNATINITVKGRSDSTKDKLASGKCGSFSSCYVTPIPGTGDAGKNCAMYKPNITIENVNNVENSLTNGVANTDQVNYSCNWNKLIFGSGQTDRVAVPLYYDEAKLDGNSSVPKNPFKDGTAKNLIVRLRTPCKPCAVDANPDFQRTCDDKVKDETVCENDDRYKLDATTSDDIVVQWLINGECTENGKTEACGVMPISQGVKDKNNKSIPVSALYETKILANSKTTLNNYEIINNKTLTYDSNNYPSLVYLLETASALSSVKKLPTMDKPVLTLFLSKPLLTEKKSNIPYLEYQVLTDSPVGNSKSSLEVTVNVEGNSFRKTLTQDVQKDLIDFAINN